MKSQIFFLFFLLSACSPYVKSVSETQVVARVLLDQSKSAQVSMNTTYFLTLGETRLLTSKNLKIEWDKKGIKVNDIVYNLDSVAIQGAKSFVFNKKQYRGDLHLYKEGDALQIVNHVPLEEYLLSVVPSEVYQSWDLETLKAQSVAARSYALFEIKRSRKKYPNRYFDLFDDTRSQVYHGVKSETRKTSQAVLATQGQVLTYNGSIIKSYFSSSVGRLSAGGEEIGDKQEYLKPVKVFRSPKNPYDSWQVEIPLSFLQQQYKTQKISAVTVSERTKSGRIQEVQLKDVNGKLKKIRGDHFRSAVGTQKMKSTFAQISVQGNKTLRIKGEGFGHGVGMGQWEAQELALRGYNYQQIVRHFYQGTKLQRLY